MNILPIHIHIEKENTTVKFNVESIAELVKSKRFNSSELKEIHNLFIEHQEFFKIKWHEYFNNN